MRRRPEENRTLDIDDTRVRRVIIENVRPQVNVGRFPIKRVPGETVEVTADVFADGHDVVKAVILHRRGEEEEWQEAPMEFLVNDVFLGSFSVSGLGTHEYTVEAWIDRFESWLKDIRKKFGAGLDVQSELLEGAALIRQMADRTKGSDAEWLGRLASRIRKNGDQAKRMEAVQSETLVKLSRQYPDRSLKTRYSRILKVTVDQEKARFGAWYEMFPRSCTTRADHHGTFRDCEKRLPYISSLGFDVLYFPPVHPIGKSFRKGPNNTLKTVPEDPGSPWAIGGKEGGHTAVHPQLGTLQDFDHLVGAARKMGIEIALDIAFQCSPDHPYVREHPEWFRHRPDGTIKYAENPPKKYQDIYPLDFECAGWKSLWNELKQVVLFWVDHGVHIFRVDNPHTKSIRFWEWLIAEVQRQHPQVVFLSEAFTRPKVMKYLAKSGFTQSYTYFTWRNTKPELIEYFTELTRSESREYLRPNLFVNTPDILHEYLQFGGKPAFQIRLVLAATLGAAYGVYGPAFELCENRAIPGTEEYRDSEKYQIRVWDIKGRNNIRDFIARVNEIRRENQALHHDWSLRFHEIDNEQMICYTKCTADRSNIVLVVVNLDPHHVQRGWLTLPMKELQLSEEGNYQVHDMLTDARYLWHGSTNYVELNPAVCPAHIFRLRRKIRTERDFDYFL